MVEQYVTQVSSLMAENIKATVFFGTAFSEDSDGSEPFLLVQAPNSTVLYDSRRTADKLGYDPTMATETHQTVLTNLGYGVNKDLAKMFVAQHHILVPPPEALIGEITLLDRSVEMTIQAVTGEINVLVWSNNAWLEHGGAPDIFGRYNDLALATKHFHAYSATVLDATRDPAKMTDYVENKLTYQQ